MLTKEITLCGKPVKLGYCYATEIAYKDMSDENIADYIKDAVTCIQQKNDPDVKHTIHAILSSILAYYEDPEKAPVTDRDIMRDATPEELGTAIFTIIGLRMDFYHVPKGEPEEKPASDGFHDGTKEEGSKN